MSSSSQTEALAIRPPADILRAADRLRIRALRLLGARSRFVDTSMGRVHWATFRGRGSLGDVALVHGLAGSMADYAALLRGLRRVFTNVHALDLPGHGRSDDPTIARVLTPQFSDIVVEALDAIGLERVSLLGHSMGGFICTLVASTAPDRIERLMLVSPGGALTSEEVLEAARKTFIIESLADAREFIARILPGNRWYAGLLARGIHRRMAQPFLRELLSGVSNDHALQPRQLAALPMPVLLMWGEEDPVFPKEHFEFWRANLPRHATVQRPAGWGHVPLWDQSRELTERILGFVA